MAEVAPLTTFDSAIKALDRFKNPGDDEKPLDDLCAASIHASFSSLFLSDKYCDITIECGGREFKVHRAVVCSQCSWFDKIFTVVPKKRTVKTTKLIGDDPDVFQRFLEFLYTGTYTVENGGEDGSENEPPTGFADMSREIQDKLSYPPRCHLSSDSALEAPATDTPLNGDSQSSLPARPVRRSNRLSHAGQTAQTAETNKEIPPEIPMAVNLYVMADKYDIPALKLLARDRFYIAAKERWINTSWEALEDTKEFEDTVLDVFISTREDDKALWEALCKLIAIKVDDDCMKKRMQQVMKEHHDLHIGVMEYVKRYTD
ncbi:hypothetical protein FGRMN_4735 [Fusarium graminum]|nr:hypothetical protein FGRMN_4735 [Fusarium graminum]